MPSLLFLIVQCLEPIGIGVVGGNVLLKECGFEKQTKAKGGWRDINSEPFPLLPRLVTGRNDPVFTESNTLCDHRIQQKANVGMSVSRLL